MAVLAHAYRDVGQFWDDTIEAFAKELSALAQAGCRYVQIDETAFAKFGDPDVQATLTARGDDWSQLIDTYIMITNRVLRAAPKSLQVATGTQKVVTRMSRSDFLMHSKFRSISSNTTRRVRAISHHCASFPNPSPSCSDWFPPKRRCWKIRRHCARAWKTRPDMSHLNGWR